MKDYDEFLKLQDQTGWVAISKDRKPRKGAGLGQRMKLQVLLEAASYVIQLEVIGKSEAKGLRQSLNQPPWWPWASGADHQEGKKTERVEENH